MKTVWIICTYLILTNSAGAWSTLLGNQIYNDTTTLNPKGILYLSAFSPYQSFPKWREWRFIIEISSQKQRSRHFYSEFGISFQGYNQTKTLNYPNCFSFFGDAGLANYINLDKQKERFMLNFAYGFTLAGLESTEAQSGFGLPQKLLYYGIGTYCKVHLLFFPFKSFGIYISSKYRIIPAWAHSNFSYTGFEFADFPRSINLQIGINYRVK